MLLQVPAPPVPPVPPQVFVSTGGMPMDPDAIMAISIVAIIVLGIILFPLLRALARRIEGKTGGAGQEELEDLRARIMALEEQVVRMPELEERVDFAERLLAKARDVERLKEG
jgi:hypothetical protein